MFPENTGRMNMGKLHFIMAPPHQTTGVYVRGTGHFTIRERLYNKYADFGEIIWCIDGIGYFMLNGKKYHLRPGYLFYYPPDSYHDFYPGKPFFNYRWLSMNGEFCADLFSALGFQAGMMFAGNCPEDRFAVLEQYLLKSIKRDMLKSLSIAFDILTYAVTPKKEDRSLPLQLRSFMEENFSNPDLNVTVLADYFHLNRVSLARMFQQQFGISPNRYLNSIRLQKGLSMLLEEPFLPIKEIAVRSGFNSSDYFIKKVQKYTGYTPLEFRKKNS